MTTDKGILIKNVYYMLAYAFQDLRHNNYEDIEGEEFDNVYDLFAEILTRGVSCQLKHGLYRSYVNREESLSTLRGRILMPETIRNYTRSVRRLHCEFDDYSENNTFNQILKTTLSLLLRHNDVKPERKSPIRNLLRYFSGVDEISLREIRWSTLRFDRNTQPSRMLLYICKFIIDRVLLTTETGSQRMASFSDENMNRLFEKFVLEYYRRHHPSLNAAARPVDWDIVLEESDTALLPAMKTDIFLHKGNRTLIIDTKYYSQSLQVHFDKATIHSGNLYQIFSYVTNHDVGHTGLVDGMLLYAKTEADIHPDGQMRLSSGNTIYFRTLDLNQPFDNIKQQLDVLILPLTSSAK